MDKSRVRGNRRGPAALALIGLAGLALSAVGADCDLKAAQPLTVLLLEYQGPEATASGQRLAKELTAQGLKDVFIVEGPEVTSVCCGRFNSWKDTAADTRLQQVRLIRDKDGQYPFANVLLVPVPETAPKNEFPIQSAKGVFTLHVGTWGLESQGRIAAAQVYAKALRAKGYEAYVYHGPRFSMVTIGGFGPEVFDDPTKVGRPGVAPKVVDPKVLALIEAFPGMKLDGQDTVVPTGLVKMPGREPPLPIAPRTDALYRIAIVLVSTQTGFPPPRGEGLGVAQGRGEIGVLARALSHQVVAGLPKGKAARIGVAGILPTDRDTAARQADKLVADAVVAALSEAVQGPQGTVANLESTGQFLDAAGLKTVDVLRDSRKVKGMQGLDYVVVGSVTVIPAR
jgi:hypothetical protein